MPRKLRSHRGKYCAKSALPLRAMQTGNSTGKERTSRLRLAFSVGTRHQERGDQWKPCWSGISPKLFALLASLTSHSLNQFAENMARTEALNAEIAIISNDLSGRSPAPRSARGRAVRNRQSSEFSSRDLVFVMAQGSYMQYCIYRCDSAGTSQRAAATGGSMASASIRPRGFFSIPCT